MAKEQIPINPILLVDDDEMTLHIYTIVLRTLGFNHIISCQDGHEALNILSEQPIEMMLLDLNMPKISGQEVLGEVKTAHPEIPVIIITGVNELDIAVECMRNGAFDYLVKPVDKDRLSVSIQHAYQMCGLRRENTRLTRHFFSQKPDFPEAFEEIITSSKSMQTVFKYCEAIADSSEPILIYGETGVGKELIAKALHKLSRRKGEFVAVNIAGLDDQMFNDILFGHVKGSFTGAQNMRKGLIEKASGGTLFLDEIGDINAESQIKLLRLLQEREFYPVGSDVPKSSDAHILIATHKNLNELQKEGQFRQDLYYRLKTHLVTIPPLRERAEDIPLLLDHFLEIAAESLGKKIPPYTQELLTLLGAYAFPGNVRELRAMIYDATSRHDQKTLSTKVFENAINESGVASPPTATSSVELTKYSWVSVLPEIPTLKEASEILVHEAMRREDSNQRAAARLLGISHQALNQRLSRMSKNPESKD